MTGMLASVENLAEARIVLEAGADIIDLKAPSEGALGALPVETVREIVAELGGRRLVSATIGDLAMNPQTVSSAVEAMAATGVDYVKIGFFPGGDWSRTILSLGPLAARGVGLVAVMFGDPRPDLSYIAELAEAGFAGVMLDTMDKGGGSLTQVCALDFLRGFITEAKSHGLLCGLAGSLRKPDIPPLLNLHPDYLGFRGALCQRHVRSSSLDMSAVQTIRNMIPFKSKSVGPEPVEG